MFQSFEDSKNITISKMKKYIKNNYDTAKLIVGEILELLN